MIWDCNIMIIGPIDHGLHVIQSREFNYYLTYTWLIKLIILTTAMSSSSYCLIAITTLSPLYRLDPQSALLFSVTDVLHVAYELNKQFALILGSQRLFAD